MALLLADCKKRYSLLFEPWDRDLDRTRVSSMDMLLLPYRGLLVVQIDVLGLESIERTSYVPVEPSCCSVEAGLCDGQWPFLRHLLM